MAAPANKTIGDLNGKWIMNKTLSSNIEPGLALQGISWMTRKAVGMATLTLDIKQFEAPPSPAEKPTEGVTSCTHIEIEQTGTAGLKGSTEKRCLDFAFREHSDWLFGHVKGQTKFVRTEDVTDEFLKSGWLDADAEKTGPDGTQHVLSYVESLDSDWTATQIWGFKIIDDVRRYVRNVVIAKGAERVELQLVYDYLSE
ncbi:hypothetical protein B0I37DRAFT_145421 [Chaetomium sp. MPI-CAGE-AT-0009]|nr:hypothetical protein B0I37DRAFT_145421 [Chaetomium sp. MPI-CAGE-AT-0009]